MGAFLAILTGALTVAGNYYAKAWSEDGRAITFMFCMLFYAAGGAVFPFSLKFGTLVLLEIVSSLSIVLITVAVGMLVFKEQVNTNQVAGIILAGIALLLFYLPVKS